MSKDKADTALQMLDSGEKSDEPKIDVERARELLPDEDLQAPREPGSIPEIPKNKFTAVAAGVFFASALALVLAVAYLFSGRSPGVKREPEYPIPTLRLPVNYWPTSYDVTVTLPYTADECVNDLNYDCPFSGTVRMALEATDWDDRLFVHCGDNLEITSATMILEDGSEYDAIGITRNEEFEVMMLDFNALSVSGSLTGTLVMTYEGKIINGVDGFYVSTYTDVNTGAERGMYATQFESTFARTAFPCLDEPAKKATFRLSFNVPASVQVYSNMLGTSSIYPEGDAEFRFDPSPVMSTYLVAFIVGRFEVNQKVADNGVLIRIIVPEGANMLPDTAFALEEAAGVLPLYDKFFNIPYPLPKLDLAAIPDFDAGAMENWGLITFRTTALIVSLTEGTEAQFQRVSVVIAHEISHQWFGDLVTMKWWNDLWLNEGFASYMEYYGVDVLHPEWEMYDQFLRLDQHRAMYLDALRSSHTLSIGDQDNPGELMDPAYINQLFDAISYSKGASVIKLLKSYFEELGTTSFNDGLTLYLTENAYGNAITSDLWDSISQVSGQDVAGMMYSWTNEIGFPVVSVGVSGSGTGVTVTQNRFLYLPYDSSTPDGSLAGDSTIWTIPLMIQEGDKLNQPPPVHLMTHRTEVLNSINPSVSFPICNLGQPSYIRCNYTENMWNQITAALGADLLSIPEEIDRAGLIDDSFAFLRGAQIGAHIPLNLTAQFADEREYVVWEELLGGLGLVDGRLATAPAATVTAFRAWAANLLTDVVTYVGFTPVDDEGHLEELLRIDVLASASSFGVPNVRETLVGYYPIEDTIDPNLLSLVFNTYVATGGQNEYTTILNRYINAATAGESPGTTVSLMLALTRAPTTALLNDLLGRMWTDVRQQDFASVLGGISRNPLGRDLAWTWAKANWPRIMEGYGDGGFALTSIISNLCSNFDTQEMYNDVTSFFSANPTPNGSKAIAQSLEYILININFKARVVPEIIAYFD